MNCFSICPVAEFTLQIPTIFLIQQPLCDQYCNIVQPTMLDECSVSSYPVALFLEDYHSCHTLCNLNIGLQRQVHCVLSSLIRSPSRHENRVILEIATFHLSQVQLCVSPILFSFSIFDPTVLTSLLIFADIEAFDIFRKPLFQIPKFSSSTGMSRVFVISSSRVNSSTCFELAVTVNKRLSNMVMPKIRSPESSTVFSSSKQNMKQKLIAWQK